MKHSASLLTCIADALQQIERFKHDNPDDHSLDETQTALSDFLARLEQDSLSASTRI
jgi:hypothetical protein